MRGLYELPLKALIRIHWPQMQVQAQIKVAIYTLCCVIYLAYIMSGKTIVSLNPGCRVMKNTLYEADGDDAQKYEELLKKANKPFHDKTTHNKLSATVYLHNLKCMGGVSNTIFLTFLKFFNQLLFDDHVVLPVNTYEAKTFLRDMSLGYEKSPACRNDCILF